MFNNDNNQQDLDVDTLIGEHTEVVGELRFHGALHLEGSIDGKLVALDEQGAAVVRGRMKGNIVAPTVIISGRVDGDIHASNRLHLKSGAQVTGKVVCRAIDMELKASLNGHLTVDPNLMAKKATKAKVS